HFAVKDERVRSVLAVEWLVPGFEIDNLEPDSAERNSLGLEDRLLIRPSVGEGRSGLPNPGTIRPTPVVCVASYAAQIVAPRLLALHPAPISLTLHPKN